MRMHHRKVSGKGRKTLGFKNNKFPLAWKALRKAKRWRKAGIDPAQIISRLHKKYSEKDYVIAMHKLIKTTGQTS